MANNRKTTIRLFLSLVLNVSDWDDEEEDGGIL